MGKGSGRFKLYDRTLKVHMTNKMLERLNKLSEVDGQSMSHEVRVAVNYYLSVREGPN